MIKLGKQTNMILFFNTRKASSKLNKSSQYYNCSKHSPIAFPEYFTTIQTFKFIRSRNLHISWLKHSLYNWIKYSRNICTCICYIHMNIDHFFIA